MTNEHTVTDPIYKGALLYALLTPPQDNKYGLFHVSAVMASPLLLADGYATFLNGYDMQIYSYRQRTKRNHSTGTTDRYHSRHQRSYTGHSDGHFRWHTANRTVKLTFQMAFHAHLTQA